MFRTFPVLEEPTPAEDGTYPDDSNQRAYGDSVKTNIREWVQLVVDPRASEAKRDEAFGLLLFTHLLLGSTGAELLWPFLLGTLLRRADAREASKDLGHDDDKDGEDVRGEVKLVQLLRLGGLVRHSYAAWLPRLLAIVESGKTPDVLKVALLEHLAINRVTPNSTKLATSLVEAVVKPATTSDKVRACAIFAVGSLLHRHTGSEQLRTTWADLFYNRTDEEQAAVQFGLLAHTAMAWVAVHHLGDQAPDAAVSQAVYALVHDLEFLSAWRVIEELLDLDKASLSDIHEKLRRGVNIGSRVSLETATVPWPSLKSFDEVCTMPLIGGD
ncbi:uncharacterized protein ACA1_235530 [Acanthamoeba castellanii str. Neff]|uniref:Uncharacterized protein n=1 Tax=Acanthamoeba castellanii (strain ATCC 30010 / Neff) TaxID=1257118 RepID=L8H197_ACACF|nr:uncharacterized protein ACA1_235530 [Acanthamoeba castellanii str. Neff]ELR19025.1 hypothetical protein ACA1_235530 [Acanthamoeba castellanii str. Neff]